MKMATIFNHKNFFNFIRMFAIKLCVIFILVMSIYILMHIYYYTNIYVHMSYSGDLEFYATSKKYARSHGCGESEDISCNRAIQAIGKSGPVNDSQFLQHTNEYQQKLLLQDEHGYMKQANNISTQKEGKWQKNKLPVNMKSKQRNVRDIGINATHINGILMEPVNVNYSRNIYFTLKTTHKYYTNRLFPLMLTWLQAVDKNKLSIITDRSPEKEIYVDMIRKAGFNLIDTDCLAAVYDNSAFCCKLNHEFSAYYKAIEEHPGEEDNYQWFCHIDDDMYVNVLQLSQFLQLYDPHKPYYIGKWPISLRRGLSNLYGVHPFKRVMQKFNRKMTYILKQTSYQYATGAAYCISYDLMMKGKEFFNPKTFNTISTEAETRADDMTVGFIIAVLLGYNLTSAPVMMNQYDTYVKRCSLQTLIRYPTASSAIIQNDSLKRFAASLKTPLPSDPTKFMLYHCLLYPTLSWCEGVRESINELQL